MKTMALRERSRVLALLVERIDREREKADHRYTCIDIDGLPVRFEDVIAGLVEVIETGRFAQEVALGEKLWRAELAAAERAEIIARRRRLYPGRYDANGDAIDGEDA